MVPLLFSLEFMALTFLFGESFISRITYPGLIIMLLFEPKGISYVTGEYSYKDFFSLYKYTLKMTNEPVHEISNNLACASSKASDQPAHTRSLIRAFACRLNIL